VLEEHPCVEAGRIGLRSVATGGRWRNISVAPAVLNDYLRIRQHVALISTPEFPEREADYNRLLPVTFFTEPVSQPPARKEPSIEETHIGDLLDAPLAAENTVMLRGVVTLTSPELYIQDSTGGILVQYASTPTLNVGDVVEVHGRAQPGFYSALINSDATRLLWVGAPVPPISITPSQAASGAYDARFIEVEGRLVRSDISSKGNQVLYLTDGVQTFRTISAYRLDEAQRQIETNSYLRIRGICALSQTYTQGLTPFAVLLRSNNDIQVLAGPPWWNPLHVSLLFAGVLCAVLLIQLAFFRFQRWKSDTITRERERLAHEIHDTMAQGFAGIGYQIQGIRKAVTHSSPVSLPHVSSQLEMAYQLVRHCHEEASRTIAMLSSVSPRIQENLLDTLADAAHRIAGNQIKTTARIEGNPVPLSLRTANSLMHIGREAITNAAGHSAPTKLTLTLRYDAHSVELIIKDDGHGFVFTPEKAGFGILGMQKRARDIGGVLQISSSPGKGTEVSIRASLHNDSISRRLIRILKDCIHPRSQRRRI
jgi:signal transduction histidine kinase